MYGLYKVCWGSKQGPIELIQGACQRNSLPEVVLDIPQADARAPSSPLSDRNQVVENGPYRSSTFRAIRPGWPKAILPMVCYILLTRQELKL